MANLEELKETVTSQLKARWEQVQDSSTFQQLKDRYENLTPPMQKLATVGGFLFAALVLFSLPWSYYSLSKDYVVEYESRRDLLQDLMRAVRDGQEAPQIPPAPDIEAIKAIIENNLKVAQLIPDQIKGTQLVTENTALVPANFSNGILQVTLAKLTTRQIVDLGFQFQSINSSVKLKDLILTQNAEDGKYYNAIYKLLVLAVPTTLTTPANDEVPPPRGKPRGNK